MSHLEITQIWNFGMKTCKSSYIQEYCSSIVVAIGTFWAVIVKNPTQNKTSIYNLRIISLG